MPNDEDKAYVYFKNDSTLTDKEIQDGIKTRFLKLIESVQRFGEQKNTPEIQMYKRIFEAAIEPPSRSTSKRTSISRTRKI